MNHRSRCPPSNRVKGRIAAEPICSQAGARARDPCRRTASISRISAPDDSPGRAPGQTRLGHAVAWPQVPKSLL